MFNPPYPQGKINPYAYVFGNCLIAGYFFGQKFSFTRFLLYYRALLMEPPRQRGIGRGGQGRIVVAEHGTGGGGGGGGGAGRVGAAHVGDG